MRKIGIEEIEALMTKRVYDLTEEELKSLGFILDLHIYEYRMIKECRVQFSIRHQWTRIVVNGHKDSCASMGKSRRVVNGISAMTSWGGVTSFANIVAMFRGYYMKGHYEMTLWGTRPARYYAKNDWEKVSELANTLVFKND